MILSESEYSYLEIVNDDEWSTTNNKQIKMYKTYVLGKIVKLDERCFRSEI